MVYGTGLKSNPCRSGVRARMPHLRHPCSSTLTPTFRCTLPATTGCNRALILPPSNSSMDILLTCELLQ